MRHNKQAMDEQGEKQVQSCNQEAFCDESVHPEMSKLAILSLVLGILSLFFFVLAAIPAIVIGILSILIIRSSAGEIRGKYIALTGISVSIVFMFVFYLLWRIDAPPIPNDYTIADLRSAPAQYAESFEILKTLLGENGDSSVVPAIELTKSDSSMIAEIKGIMETAATPEITKAISYNTEEINQIWADNERARDIIHQLDEFPEITEESTFENIIRFKKNSALRLLRNSYDSWLDAEQGRQNVAKTKLSVWPDIYPFKEPSISSTNLEQLPLIYRCSIIHT